MTCRQPVEEYIEDETDPEVLFDVTGQRIEPDRGCFEHVPLVLLGKSQKPVKVPIHAATGLSAVMSCTNGNAQPGRF